MVFSIFAHMTSCAGYGFSWIYEFLIGLLLQICKHCWH